MYICDLSSYQFPSGSLELLNTFKLFPVEHFCLAVFMAVLLVLFNAEAISTHRYYFTFYKNVTFHHLRINVAGALKSAYRHISLGNRRYGAVDYPVA